MNAARLQDLKRATTRGHVAKADIAASRSRKLNPDPMPQALGQRMAQRERRPTNVRALIAELQEQATRLLDYSKQVEREADRRGLTGYRDLQQKVMEFDSFAAVIENQLIDIKFRDKDDLRRRFDDVTLVVLSALVGAKLRFLNTFKNRQIPLGTRGVFIKELRAIRAASDRLTDPKHRAQLSAEAGDNIKVAENVLRDIISRAVDIPRF